MDYEGEFCGVSILWTIAFAVIGIGAIAIIAWGLILCAKYSGAP